MCKKLRAAVAMLNVLRIQNCTVESEVEACTEVDMIRKENGMESMGKKEIREEFRKDHSLFTWREHDLFNEIDRLDKELAKQTQRKIK